MKSTASILTVLAALLLLAGWGGTQPSQHEQHQGETPHPQGNMHGGEQGEMMPGCRMMKGQHQKMMSQMQARDEELQSLVAEMRAAGDEGDKIAAMETLLARMVESRIEMHEQMMVQMMPAMMRHMSHHMEMMQKEEGHSPMSCPMMGGDEHHSEGSGTGSW